MKTATGKLSDDQDKFIRLCSAQGVDVFVARSFDQAREYTIRRLGLTF